MSDKIGSLDSNSREKVVQYYAKIKFMEDMLRIIHSTTHTDFSEEIQLIKNPGETYFTNAEEAYSIGEKLIKSLKEQI